MADPQNPIPQAAPAQPDTIDISAGLVPRDAPDIDLSAGLVPKTSAAGNPNFDLATPRAAGGGGPVGAAIGFGKGALETTAGVGEMIHALPGGDKIIPSEGLRAEESAAERHGATEDLGNFAENVGEFAAGGEAVDALKGVSWIHKLSKVPFLLDIMEKYPKSTKALMNVAKSTTVGAGQGAVKGASEGQGDAVLAKVKAEQGAVSGAEGAAIGSTAAEGLGAVAKPLAQKVGLATEELDDATRALQPGKRNYKFAQNWSQARERIAAELDENGKFENMADAADRFRDVRQNLWNQEIKSEIDARANKPIFNTQPPKAGAMPAQPGWGTSNPIADAIRSKISKSGSQVAKFTKEFDAGLETEAKKFDNANLTVGDAETILERYNAELANAKYWEKTPSQRATMEKADPYIASRVLATDQLRESLYDFLEKDGVKDIQQKKATYGAISSLENDVRGQVNVAGRQRPVSLKQIIGIGAGLVKGGAKGLAVGVGAPLLDKLYNSPEELLNRAATKAAPAGAVKAAVQDVVSGAGTVAKKAAPVAGENLLRFQGSDGGVYFTPADKKDEILKKDPGAKFQ